MVEHGVLAVEMEASALYTLAAQYGARALAICTVSGPHRHRRGDDQPGA
jgi:purine-nucleoside phosphorylase